MKQNATFDTSFWINSYRSGLLTHVLDRYRLHYEPAVAEELQETFPSGYEFWRLVREGSLIEAHATKSQVREFGHGERAAMNVALASPELSLLLDDYRPFRVTVQIGLHVICTPVLVVDLFMDGVIDAERALLMLARLAALQTVSPHLLAAALAQLGKGLRAQGGY